MSSLTLKKSNCKNCYKCIRHCPVKSIRFSGNQAYINDDECIMCGHCFVVCPQDAKEIVNKSEKVKVFIQSQEPVFVSLAPSFIANYEGSGINAMRDALKKLGFYDVEETALGATIVKKEYDRMINEEEKNIIISSCCHSINLLIQKHFPKQLPYLADVLSPMQAHCLDIKKRYPKAKTVFIGPCVAKKDEASTYDDMVDAVLTFDELSAWLMEEQIELKQEKDFTDESLARFFPTTGGILKTMACDNPNYTYLAIDGVDNCIAALEDIKNEKITNCFIEMSACVGSCVGGPIMEKFHRAPVQEYISIANYAGKADFEIEQPDSSLLKKHFHKIDLHQKYPSNHELREILKEMGKSDPIDELNCGTCGYNTCQDKAVAIFQGKAEISMCLPFLKEKAERFSDSIFRNTPNAIVTLNEQLEIQQINNIALKIMNISSSSDVLGENVVRILDPKNFIEVRNTSRNLYNKRVYLAEYNKYVEQTIVYDKAYHLIVCIMRDVTDEQMERERKEMISAQTIEVADKVVEKQMRIVQEIASLLGETTAETKVALTKLKESISNE